MLEGFEVEGYPAGWSPPRELANRILEDTDFDGFFDLEGVTGHDGWVCPCTGDTPEAECEDPFER